MSHSADELRKRLQERLALDNENNAYHTGYVWRHTSPELELLDQAIAEAKQIMKTPMIRTKEPLAPRFTTDEEQELLDSFRTEERRLFQVRQDALRKHDEAVWALDDFRQLLKTRGAVER